jgi:hypothetical protein
MYNNDTRLTVIDNSAALARIEAAEQQMPFCWCGAPTIPVERGESIRLGCSSLQQPSGMFRRLLTLEIAAGHIDRPILEASEFKAVA